jgi:hypothetical protein
LQRSTATAWWLVGLTPMIMWLTHYLAVLPHEFSHSVVAWIVGIKPAPGNISWGGTSLWNITLLAHVDENVDYQAALAAGRNWEVAVTAAAGLMIGNALPYLVVRSLMFEGAFARSRPVWLYVVFWYLFFGAANLYDHVPTRMFSDDGDVAHFVEGSHIDRWWIYAIGTALVLWVIVDMYRSVLPRVLDFCGFGDLRAARALVLIATSAVRFGYFAKSRRWRRPTR